MTMMGSRSRAVFVAVVVAVVVDDKDDDWG